MQAAFAAELSGLAARSTTHKTLPVRVACINLAGGVLAFWGCGAMVFAEWLSFQRDRNDYVGDAARSVDMCYSAIATIDDRFLLGELLNRCQFESATQRGVFDAWEEFRKLLFRQYLALNNPYRKHIDWGTPEKIATEKLIFSECTSARSNALRAKYGANAWEQNSGWAPRDRPGYVYYMQAENGLCKIGRTKHIDQRFKAIDLVIPWDLKLVVAIPTDDCVELERQHHNANILHNVKGEWFDLPKDYVENVSAWSEGVLLYQPDMDTPLVGNFIPKQYRDLSIPDDLKWKETR